MNITHIRSLGYRTDLLFQRYAGEIVARDDYLVARSPDNPHYFWGNFLLFGAPPADGDFERWIRRFEAEFPDRTVSSHMTFGWDSPEGELGVVAPFVEAGFNLDTSTVLTANQVERPPRWNRDVVARALESDDDWEAATLNQLRCRPDTMAAGPYEQFKRAQMRSYRHMSEAGQGRWLGAFLDGRLVGDLGLFMVGDVGRFQTVGTQPAHRRQGVCATLVHAASELAFRTLGARTLVIVAEPETTAARVYQSVGFNAAEKQVGLCRWDRQALGAGG